MNDYELMIVSLDILAEKDIDIVPLVSKSYLENANGDTKVYQSADQLQLDYMVSKVVEMLLFFAEDNPRKEELSHHDVPYHNELGVTFEMYREYIDILIATLRDSLGDAWNVSIKQAWDNQKEAVLKTVERGCPAYGKKC